MSSELKANILLVDDRVENLIALEAILSRLGQNLVTARSGEEALRCLLNQDFAVILLDVQMPGMDGFETASLIRQRERSQQTPIIFVTAFSTNDQWQMKGYALGAVDYLLKPVNPEILISKVAVFVELFKKSEEIQRQSAELAVQKIEIIQEQLARQQAESANQMKDEFMAIVSHELRTPLNAILGWSKLLVTDKLDALAARRALETIHRNAQSQAQLVEDILDVARLTSGKVQIRQHPINIVNLISEELESIRPAADEKGIQLTTELTCDRCIVNGDIQRLQQVLRNLLSNAIKFTPEGGQVDVKLNQVMGRESGGSGRQTPQPTTRHPLPLTAFAQIIVTDTGIGIDPDFLPQIFEYFRQADSSSTRSHDGLGLGLAIVRQLVELHGGRIDAASKGKNKGTTFTILLPLHTTTSQPDTSSQRSTPELLPGSLVLEDISVLIVDDNSDNRSYLATVLEIAGAKVTAVASGQEGMDCLQHAQPDVLLSDIAMPDENGYELLHRVRTFEQEQGVRTIPAIALTAYTKPEDRHQALSVGFQQFLSKPIDPTQLIEAVAEAVRTKVGKLPAL